MGCLETGQRTWATTELRLSYCYAMEFLARLTRFFGRLPVNLVTPVIDIPLDATLIFLPAAGVTKGWLTLVGLSKPLD